MAEHGAPLPQPGEAAHALPPTGPVAVPGEAVRPLQPLPAGMRAPAPGTREGPFAAKKPPTFVCGMGILAMLVLFQSAAVPRVDAALHILPPWALLGQAGGLTFHAAVFFGVLFPVVIGRIPIPYIVRTGAMLSAGVALLVFAISHMNIALGEFAFRGHPGLLAAFGSWGLLALLLGSLLFPAALFWRSRYTASFWSRIAVLAGVLVVLGAYLLGGLAAGIEGPIPLLDLIETLRNEGAYRADRISAAALLIPLCLVPLSAFVFLPHPRSGLAGLWAWLHVTALAAVPLIQAGFVASFREGGYKYVFAPLKVSLLLYAALLVLPVALGHTAGEIERLIALRAQKKQRG